jgi:hypothetical protein
LNVSKFEQHGEAGKLPDDAPDPRQMAIYAAWTPDQLWKQASRLREMAWNLEISMTCGEHPEWTQEETLDHVRSLFLHART